jgi:hypothetical protein
MDNILNDNIHIEYGFEKTTIVIVEIAHLTTCYIMLTRY